jgi:hypothetical protein
LPDVQPRTYALGYFQSSLRDFTGTFVST